MRDLPSGFIFCWPTSCGRLEIQYQARHTTKVPTEDNQAELERLRNIVTAEFAALEGILNGRSLLVTTGNYVPFDADSGTDFESHDDEDVPALALDNPRQVPIELRPLPLPSYSGSNEHAQVELHVRKHQAENLLNSLRESIAEKSCQYSHVMRRAPRKGVRTRARATVANLNSKIVHHSTAYRRCRSAMERLGADAHLLQRFKPLSREDIQASTAIINPNEPGSSTLRLSWIWQFHSTTNVGSALSSPSELLECVSHF